MEGWVGPGLLQPVLSCLSFPNSYGLPTYKNTGLSREVAGEGQRTRQRTLHHFNGGHTGTTWRLFFHRFEGTIFPFLSKMFSKHNNFKANFKYFLGPPGSAPEKTHFERHYRTQSGKTQFT
jgi:hypothetical protein